MLKAALLLLLNLLMQFKLYPLEVPCFLESYSGWYATVNLYPLVNKHLPAIHVSQYVDVSLFCDLLNLFHGPYLEITIIL